jgi:hypothetical protein
LLDTDKVCLVAKHLYGDKNPVINTEAEIVDAANGVVRINIPARVVSAPGLLVAELIVDRLVDAGAASSSSSSAESSSSAGGSTSTGSREVIARIKLYVEIAENIAHMDKALTALSIAEIRIAMRDRCPEANFLIDDVEFSNEEIAFCIRRPVDYWNETPPPLRVFTPGNFPFRYHWCEATIAQLLRIGAIWYSRNHLTYQAAGVSVNDKDKSNEYMQIHQQIWGEYKNWVLLQKKSMNLDQMYATTNLTSFGSIPVSRRGTFPIISQ